MLVAVYFLTRRGVKGFDPARALAVPLYCGAALLVVGAMFVFTARNQTRNSAVLARNFYELLNVRELSVSQPDGRAYSLFHGQIVHGYQFRSEAERRLTGSTRAAPLKPDLAVVDGRLQQFVLVLRRLQM